MGFEKMPVNNQENNEEKNNNDELARKALEKLKSRGEVYLGQETDDFGESKFNGYGEIIEAKEDSISSENKAEVREAQPNPELVVQLSLFKEKLNPKAEIIYYPCCASDISPSKAFPESKVIYADIDDKSIEALRKKGCEANNASALEFDPGEVDILIIMNPVISPEVPASYVKEGGFVLSNDYHRSASYLNQQEEYELKARIGKKSEKEFEFDTEDLEDYWKEVENDEEFKNALFNFDSINYKGAALIVEKITGKTQDVLSEYKKIVEMAREQECKKYTEIINENPEMEKYFPNPDQKSSFMLNYEGNQFVIIADLPRKKGTVDDLFVFQKRKLEKPQE